jgi:putative endonuclease
MNNAQQYFVYILECADGKYYTGSTTSLEERVNEHQIGLDPFSFTYCRRPVKLVWCESYDSLMEAAAVERQLKGWARRKKEALIRGDWDAVHEVVKAERKRREKGR